MNLQYKQGSQTQGASARLIRRVLRLHSPTAPADALKNRPYTEEQGGMLENC